MRPLILKRISALCRPEFSVESVRPRSSVNLLASRMHTSTSIGSNLNGIEIIRKQYIGGQWVNSSTTDCVDVYDSNTGSVFARVPAGSEEDMEAAIKSAAAAFESWSARPLRQRVEHMQRLLEEYSRVKDRVARVLTQELGSPVPLSYRSQSALFAYHLKSVLRFVEKYQWEEDIGKSLLVKEPIGVVGCITPWNWPLNQIGCKICPAIVAGCTVVLKPSEVTPLNAYILTEAISHNCDFPPGVFNMVCGTGKRCGEVLATHEKVDMVSFTGSTPVGRHLHALGAATLKRVRSELGGKSAAIILEDATSDQIKLMASDVLGNTGQSCNALSRLLAPVSRYEEVCSLAKEVFESVSVVRGSDQSAKDGDIGPLSSKEQFDKVSYYIQKGIDEGATLLVGGTGRPDGFSSGYFVKPTIFANVNNDMTIAREEIFGPVLCIIPYDGVENAVTIANDTIYGLNNAVASLDFRKAVKIAKRLRSGQVMVNTLESSAMAPFGGYKQSGDGREWGIAGMEEFLEIKAINKPPGAKL